MVGVVVVVEWNELKKSRRATAWKHRVNVEEFSSERGMNEKPKELL